MKAASPARVSARWAVLQNGGKHGIDLLVFLCLARLVAPQDFGLVAMAGALVVLMSIVAELGLGDALIQRRDLRPEHAHSAFWFALGVGCALALALFLAAPAAAQAYGQAELVPLLRALCPLFVMHALNIVPQALLQREMAFRPLALRSLSGSVAGGVAGLSLAYLHAGAWSLVAQQLVSVGVGLVGLWLFSPWRPAWRASRAALSELLGFGRFVLGARLLNVLASKADDIIVGLVLGPLALGFYSVACRMLLALEQLFCQGVDSLALAALSRTNGSRQAMRPVFLAATRTAASLALPVFGGAALLAPDLVRLAIGEAWMPGVPLLRWLLLAGMIHAVVHFNHAVFKACGRPGLSLRMAGLSTALNVVTLAVAVQFGIEAVAVSYLLRLVLVAPVGVQLACRLLDLPLRSYLACLWRPIVAMALAAPAVLLTPRWLPELAGAHAAPLTRLLLLAAVGGAVYALAYFPPGRLVPRRALSAPQP